MKNEKTTREYFEAIRAFVIENGGNDEFEAFLTTKITQLEDRAKRAKEKRAEKTAEPDPYIDAIAGVLGEEPMTADEIIAALGIEDLTKNKVTARIGKIEGVEKVDIKVEVDGKKLKRTAYVKA